MNWRRSSYTGSNGGNCVEVTVVAPGGGGDRIE